GVPADDTSAVPDGPIPITSALEWFRENPTVSSGGTGLPRSTNRAENGTEARS
ncbi:MAG: hypothetical protein RL022_1921, partial [Chloroflexota bacterium]